MFSTCTYLWWSHPNFPFAVYFIIYDSCFASVRDRSNLYQAMAEPVRLTAPAETIVSQCLFKCITPSAMKVRKHTHFWSFNMSSYKSFVFRCLRNCPRTFAVKGCNSWTGMSSFKDDGGASKETVTKLLDFAWTEQTWENIKVISIT